MKSTSNKEHRTKRYVCTVIETRTIPVVYTVEANSVEEAKDKAMLGETVSEIPQEFEMEVNSRDLYDTPIEEDE